MTVDEIKQTYTMRDILQKCGLHLPNKAGFIHCPFHKGDREPSMKIYRDSYFCFACGLGGDIFDFVMELYKIDFKEAFRMLGGSYEKTSFSTNLAVYKVKQEKKMKEKEAEKHRRKCELNNMLIDIYRDWVNKSEPFSEAWCDCYNALQYQLYVNEILNEKRTGC